MFSRVLLLSLVSLALTIGAAVDPGTFDPATAKLGGVLILTVQMTIMAQFKDFFRLNPRGRIYDFLNYPVAFLLVIPVLPPWPLWSFGAWSNYVAGAIGLAVLASVTAQKTRDTPSRGAPNDAAPAEEG